MAATTEAVEINIPSLPAPHDQFLEYVAKHPDTPMRDLIEPYKEYDTEMRKVFAQNPQHPAAQKPSVVPVFAGGFEKEATIRARDLDSESDKEKACFIMPLKNKDRKPNGSPAIVQSLKDFRTNFNVFSESSLADLDWSNVVAAGSAVVTSLLAVPDKHGSSKRALREYYHEQIAPASDVDLFIYGLTEEEATKKIKQIEQNIRDAILVESTTIRTKNAITIASQYPTRHVQIVLRIYKSISEILTGFDVDCSCAAYDGKQVYASPRALAAYMTQINTIDLTRRSPSYENRLSKYAHRGFEVYWPNLDRSRVDPTIFERSFGRTEGLARLLILEKLPKSRDRDAYLDQRRAERGRPAVNRWRMSRRMIRGNIKNDYEDEVAEWVDADDVSDYHTFTIPYGPKFHSKKIEKLLYTKDLLLNAEWNKPKDREVNLHRHPAFFGRAEDVFHDCCGTCPQPMTVEEEEVAEEEAKVYISGNISFIKDDPGRQTIGSFNPLTADDWTEMAYVGNTEMFCKAIVDGDVEFVRSWLRQEGNDPNTRDYTGRAPIHLAAANASLETVQLLIDHGARLVARLVDGKTALHLAAMRGSADIVSALLRKSEANDEEEQKKVDAKRATRAAAKGDGKSLDVAMKDTNLSGDQDSSDAEEDSDVDMMDDADEDEDMDATTENSIVNVKSPAPEVDDKALDEDDDEPDVYDVNVLAWDTAISPLHLAIVKGHVEVVKILVQEFGADVLLPIKLLSDYDKSARAAILTMVLALQLPLEKAQEMTQVLLQLGATTAQADLNEHTVLEYCVADRPEMLKQLIDADKTGISRAIKHLSLSGYQYRPEVSSAFLTAVKCRDSSTALSLLANGAKPGVPFDAYMKAYQTKFGNHYWNDSKIARQEFEKSVQQPVISAVQCELPDLAQCLVDDHGADPNTLTTTGWTVVHDENWRRHTQGTSLLDEVRSKLKELREWEGEAGKVEDDPPLPLKDDAHYLSSLQDGSYALWSAKKQLQSAKEQYKRDLKEYERSLEQSKKIPAGTAEKKAAIQKMIARFEELESSLVKSGAKTFKEQYPDIKDPDERQPYYGWRSEPTKPKPFEVNFNYRLGNLTDEAQERYLSLFEATWKGDLQTIKQLTLASWKNADGDDQPPLTISVQDQHNLTPFAIAVLQSQFELATAIMEIARAQYVKPDAPKARRYGVDGGNEDDSVDGDDDDVPLYSEIVDEQFTIDTIGEVSTQVKCHTQAIAMLQWQYPVVDFMGGPLRNSPSSGNGFSYFGPRRQHTMAGKRTNTGSLKAASNHLSDEKRAEIGSPTNLIQFALHNDDQDLLVYLLDLAGDVMRADAKADDEAVRYFSINERDYLEAIKLDRPHLLAEIIKRTGAGLPLNSLVKKAGVEIKEKPKYYQGLSVYGKKRQDWADAGRGTISHQVVENHTPGLLEAARYQSLEAVEWFLTDAPLRCYKEFAAAHKDDKRIKSLSEEVKGGFEAMVSKFLSARSRLAISCCLLGRPMPETMPLLRFLMKEMPEAINAKNQEGLTPLQIAFWHYREEAAKVLIQNGADQTCRDKAGNNIVHSLLRRPVSTKNKLETLPRMLDLIDKRLVTDMFFDRTSEHPGALTPLAQWIKQATSNASAYDKHQKEVLEIILKYSGGKELNVINGEGHTPLHVTVREQNALLSEVILQQDPTLLMRENATGRTPFEMAEDADISEICSNPPALPGIVRQNSRARRARKLNNFETDLVSIHPLSFVEGSGKDTRTRREKTWDLLQEYRAKLEAQGQAKRRLITLNEANEVARRLTANKSCQQYARPSHEEDVGGEVEEDSREGADEVALWMPHARSYLDDKSDDKKGGLLDA